MPGSKVSIPTEYDEIALIDRLADGDITKFAQIYQIPYREALNLLNYWLVRDKAQEQARKAQESEENRNQKAIRKGGQ